MKIINLSDNPIYAKKYEKLIGESLAKLIVKFNHYTVDGLIKEIETGQKILWTILTNDSKFLAMVLTQDLHLMNGDTVLEVTELAGSGGQKLFNVITLLEDWAKSQKYTAIRTYGRFGWHKVFSKYQYRLLYGVYEKGI